MSTLVHTVALMDTVVSMRVVLGPRRRREANAAIRRGVEWFHHVERHCSRFNTDSDVARVAAAQGEPIAVDATTLEATRFALALADATGGAFDPTIGGAMESRGFDIEFRTGARVSTSLPTAAVSYRDVRLDAAARTISTDKPLLLDLGAVAKGLAVDLASRELDAFDGWVIDAGGDIYAGGLNEQGEAWSVGIRDPRNAHALIDTVRVSGAAVCTSGTYDRRSATGNAHIVDARGGEADAALAATVIAPSAMVADGLSTAALVLGADHGLRLLEREGVRGFIVDSELRRHDTA